MAFLHLVFCDFCAAAGNAPLYGLAVAAVILFYILPHLLNMPCRIWWLNTPEPKWPFSGEEAVWQGDGKNSLWLPLAWYQVLNTCPLA